MSSITNPAPAAATSTPDQAKAPRRKNPVTIETPPEVDALIALFGGTREEFIASAVKRQIDVYKARIGILPSLEPTAAHAAAPTPAPVAQP